MTILKHFTFSLFLFVLTGCSLMSASNQHQPSPNFDDPTMNNPTPIILLTIPTLNPPPTDSYLIGSESDLTTLTSPLLVPNLVPYTKLTSNVYCLSLSENDPLPSITAFDPSTNPSQLWSTPLIQSYDGTATNTSYFQTLNVPAPYNTCAWVVSSFTDDAGNVYESVGPDFESLSYTIFSFKNSNGSPTPPILQSVINTVAAPYLSSQTPFTTQVQPIIQTLYENTAFQSVITAYVWTQH